jgi:type II secretory pathway pseudopilin PulG
LPVTGSGAAVIVVFALVSLVIGIMLVRLGRRRSAAAVAIALLAALSMSVSEQRADAANEPCFPTTTTTTSVAIGSSGDVPATTTATTTPATTTTAAPTTTTTIPVVGGIVAGTYLRSGIQSGNGPVASAVVALRFAGADGLLDTADDIERTTSTDSVGHYSFGRVAAGEYRVTVVDLPAVAEDYSVQLRSDASQLTIDGNWGTLGVAGLTTTITLYGPDNLRGTTDDTTMASVTFGTGNFLAAAPGFELSGLIDIEVSLPGHIGRTVQVNMVAGSVRGVGVSPWSASPNSTAVTVVADVDQTGLDFTAVTLDTSTGILIP